MLSLEEAIKHCEEVAEEQEKKARKKNDGTMSTRIKCEECAEEHRQLADWLRELKAYREIMIYLFTNVVDGGYLLYKWTDEFGYVIQVTDIISAFEEVKDIQNANIERERV